MQMIIRITMGFFASVMMSHVWGATAPLATAPTARVSNVNEVAQPRLTATLNMHEAQPRLYARIVVEQTQAQAGKITVVWIPPKDSFCRASTYDLSYQGKRYHTYCYRTIVHEMKGKLHHCRGLWTIEVHDAYGVSLAHTHHLVG